MKQNTGMGVLANIENATRSRKFVSLAKHVMQGRHPVLTSPYRQKKTARLSVS